MLRFAVEAAASQSDLQTCVRSRNYEHGSPRLVAERERQGVEPLVEFRQLLRTYIEISITVMKAFQFLMVHQDVRDSEIPEPREPFFGCAPMAKISASCGPLKAVADSTGASTRRERIRQSAELCVSRRRDVRSQNGSLPGREQGAGRKPLRTSGFESVLHTGTTLVA